MYFAQGHVAYKYATASGEGPMLNWIHHNSYLICVTLVLWAVFLFIFGFTWRLGHLQDAPDDEK